MKVKFSKSLLPVKAHFFFFFAACGPILPQLNVFGRQLGVSAGVMGLVTSVLPLMWAAAKPLFGYVVDYWPAHRKMVFMLLICLMTASYCSLWFLPMPEPQNVHPELKQIYLINDTVYLKQTDEENNNSTVLHKYTCQWDCTKESFTIYLKNTTVVDTIYFGRETKNVTCSNFYMDVVDFENDFKCLKKNKCSLLCFDDILRRKREIDFNGLDNKQNLVMAHKNTVVGRNVSDDNNNFNMKHFAPVVDKNVSANNLYISGPFWAFVVLYCVGTVAFNVANCIGDAVCFDVLGPESSTKYGAQRAWGTVGYGITALLGGWLIDYISVDDCKDFTPAFILAIAFTAVDLYSCRRLKLPSFSSPKDSGKALREILRMPKVLVFLLFAIVAGTFDSFIIYYMFWFLEELAEQTGHVASMKLIEGIVVAGQCFVGELVFFFFSGKILNRFGFGTTLTVSLLCYGLRMTLISFIQNPWHMVIIESVMQGPTYALCYATIVGYAAHVAPEGYTATVQGVVAGMDDGVGFAIGSLLGGTLYGYCGGRTAFRVFAAVAVLASILHAVLYALVMRRDERVVKAQEVLYKEEEDAMLEENNATAIYKDTVVPLASGNLNSESIEVPRRCQL